MKALFTLSMLFIVSFAHAWEPVLECDGKALVIDEECQNYRQVECYARKRQLVINNTEIVSYFEKSGILRSASDGRFLTASSVEQVNNDFIIKTSANGLPVMIKISRTENAATLEAFNYEEIPGPHGVRIQYSERLADWNFQNCK
jgi:hypothetical protein